MGIKWDDNTRWDDGTEWTDDAAQPVNPLSIQNYNELKSAVASWMARPELNSQIEDFIALGEAQFNRRLRIRVMEQETDLTINAEQISFPANFRRVRRLYLDTNPVVDLKYVSPEQLRDQYPSSTQGKPAVFTMMGDDFFFRPVPDTSYTGKLFYYGAFTPLSTANTTNTMLSRNPDLYLFGSLIAGEEYFHNDPRLGYWLQRYEQIIKEIKDEDTGDRASGSAMYQRAERPERWR